MSKRRWYRFIDFSDSEDESECLPHFVIHPSLDKQYYEKFDRFERIREWTIFYYQIPDTVKEKKKVTFDASAVII